MKKMIDNPLLMLPYFPVKKCAKNATVVYLLQSCYLGKQSALTGALQYFSNAQQCRSWQQAEAAQQYTCLAHKKLEHLDFLAQLLVAYGGNTGLYLPSPHGFQPWTTSKLTTYPTPERMHQATTQREQATIALYRKLLAHLPEVENQAVVERLLTDLAVLVELTSA